MLDCIVVVVALVKEIELILIVQLGGRGGGGFRGGGRGGYQGHYDTGPPEEVVGK